jgi:hypothetical protein
MPNKDQVTRLNSILDSFAHLKLFLKVIFLCVFMAVLICIGTVWMRAPVPTARLLLLLLAFCAAIGLVVYQTNEVIEKIRGGQVGELNIDSVIVGATLTLIAVCGVFIEMAGLTSFSPDGFKAACIGLLASLASWISGALIGFLFGVPRSFAAPPVSRLAAPAPGPKTPAGPETPAANLVVSHPLFEANTNLTQISDWLTKTIVGVGLVNWNMGLKWFEDTAAALGNGLGLGTGGSAVGGSIIVFFGVNGFLCGYSMTQLFLARALARAEQKGYSPPL